MWELSVFLRKPIFGLWPCRVVTLVPFARSPVHDVVPGAIRGVPIPRCDQRARENWVLRRDTEDRSIPCNHIQCFQKRIGVQGMLPDKKRRLANEKKEGFPKERSVCRKQAPKEARDRKEETKKPS